MCATYTCDRVLDSLGAEVTGKCELPKTVMASKLGSSYKEATLLTTKSTEGLEDVQSYTLFFLFEKLLYPHIRRENINKEYN